MANTTTQPTQESFADTLYKEITAVIGGDNPNQFFCMSLPGTIIEPSQYSYDVEANEEKPAHVKANESKLVNKLFDACYMTASDNGRHLQTQYRTSLNMLMPKMNTKLFEAKTKLREALMTPYPYNFGDGSTEVFTLEQVFYKLYADYVNAKQEWDQKQLDKKNELIQKYPDATAESYRKRNDDYLNWYGIVAKTEELEVQEKYGKVLSVFSPGDMDIINGILESGVGRELTEARTTLDNVGELNPDGGYIYPVTLYPQNWFNLLDTSFTPVDLLESPAALSQRLHLLEMQRSSINMNMNKLLQSIPDEAGVEDLKAKYEACEKAYTDKFQDYIKENTNFTMDMFKTAVDVIASGTGENEQASVDKLQKSSAKRIFGVEAEKLDEVLNKFKEGISSCISAQNDLVDAASKATDSALEWCAKNNKLQLKALLEPLKQQQDDINNQINELKEKINLSTSMNKDEAEDSQGNASKPEASDVAPNKVADQFTQVIIEKKLSAATQESSMQSNASQSSSGVSFFFGGYSSNKSHQDSVSSEMSSTSDMDIQIGMSVAKVSIEREWFNPAVFLLSSDMYNTSTQKIAPVDTTSFNSENKEEVQKRFNSMNECIFPCYPASFVIAKDVTIKFSSQKAMNSAFAKSVEDHSSKGGGFFIFGGSSSSASSSSNSSSVATSTAHSVTVRFTAPQVIGYYLEAVPADKSIHISNAVTNRDDDFISVLQFINTFKKMLDDHNNKYNKEPVQEQNSLAQEI